MWAGGRLCFGSPLRIGVPALRRSTVIAASRKHGRSGPLVFVTVRHELTQGADEPLLVEEHDIVYRGPRIGVAAPTQAPAGETWRREVSLDLVTLFQYSALTFNSYRIHYDPDYAVRQEDYPGAVVHGPLLATMLLDLVARNQPASRVTTFSFRALAPLFAGDVISLTAALDPGGGMVRLWAAGTGRGLAMEAEAVMATI